MLNIGLVGLGFMAATHLRAYRQVEGARVAALCNPSGRHLDGDFTNVAGNVGATDPVVLDMAGVKATKRFTELLDDPDLHAIDICAPTKAHAELAIAALQAGKHVLCEKPLARTSAAARQIVDAAAKAKGIFMPAMCLRFWPEWAWLKEAIASGRLGNVLAARFRRVAEPPGWGRNTFFNGAESGGALFDLHVHDTDFVNFRRRTTTSLEARRRSSSVKKASFRGSWPCPSSRPTATWGNCAILSSASAVARRPRSSPRATGWPRLRFAKLKKGR